MKNRDSLYHFLEKSYEKYNRISYARTDPIFYPIFHEGNKEYIAIISALFAYGKVSLIQKFLDSYFDVFGFNPSKRVEKVNLYYRFQKSLDIVILHNFLFDIYDKYGSIRDLFLFFSDNLEKSLKNFINAGREFGIKYGAGSGYFQLFPDPDKSGLKRLRMFLRWMVRDDEIDLGLWKGYSPKELMYPIDTHILRFAKHFSIIKSENNIAKNSKIITDFFVEINSVDPLKYDFTITRLGMLCNCHFDRSSLCENCIYFAECPF
ncbi:MAG: TIGR02757 family protein [Calditerrivibrio sp.]|nr:TIGR02757 family protein [Calditerrivibrio sp.]MCA1932303.1 TIGR02757 family protein [Calditerrivibrio sp.]MCA1981164.1 TIGR02757 family protein [Calditerrivibrio sp.]